MRYETPFRYSQAKAWTQMLEVCGQLHYQSNHRDAILAPPEKNQYEMFYQLHNKFILSEAA